MKENKGIVFVITLLVIAIVVICGLCYYIYMTRVNENQEIAELRAEIKTLQEQNSNYQTALEGINKSLDNLKGNKEEPETTKATTNEVTNEVVNNTVTTH